MKFLNLSRAALMLAVVIVAALPACSDDKDKDGQVAVTNVSIASDPGNALRYPVDIVTTADCEVSISYWPADAPAKERTTRVVPTAGNKAQVTVMFVTPSTDYVFAVNINGVRQSGTYDFRTSALPGGVPVYKIAADNGGAPTKGYILQWQASTPGYYTFCDMDGNVVWYQQVDQDARTGFYNPEDRKLYVTTGYNMDLEPTYMAARFCEKIYSMDLYGNRDLTFDTHVGQLKYSHHEFKVMPDGNLLTVVNYLKNYDLSSLGLGDNEEVFGDGYLIFDRDGKEVAHWDTFDECTPFNSNNVILEYGAVYDFVHCNSVNYDSEGNFYLTFNRLHQLWKVDARTGKVLYRVGKNGNVAISDDLIPEGIHAAVPLAPDKIMVVDNGEKRGYSRTLVYDVDPAAMTATASINISYPGLYSSSNRSNSELLPDGKTIMFASTEGHACVFTDLEGNILKIFTRDGIAYRSHYYEDVME